MSLGFTWCAVHKMPVAACPCDRAATPQPQPHPPAADGPPEPIPVHPGRCIYCRFEWDIPDVWLAFQSDPDKVICVRCFRRHAYGDEAQVTPKLRRDVSAATGGL